MPFYCQTVCAYKDQTCPYFGLCMLELGSDPSLCLCICQLRRRRHPGQQTEQGTVPRPLSHKYVCKLSDPFFHSIVYMQCTMLHVRWGMKCLTSLKRLSHEPLRPAPGDLLTLASNSAVLPDSVKPASQAVLKLVRAGGNTEVLRTSQKLTPQ